MSSATSATVQERLEATRAELQPASDAFDLALANGSDAEIAQAEERLSQLRRTCARLERQVGVLKTVEVVDERLQRARARKRIDEELIRCRRVASAALEEFVLQLREHLLALRRLAREAMGAQLDALAEAQGASDAYYEHAPARAVERTYFVHAIDPAMLSVLAGLYLPEDLKRPHLGDLNALLGIEAFLRTIDDAAPRPAA